MSTKSTREHGEYYSNDPSRSFEDNVLRKYGPGPGEDLGAPSGVDPEDARRWGNRLMHQIFVTYAVLLPIVLWLLWRFRWTA